MRSAFSQYFIKPGLIEIEYSRMLKNAFDLRLDSDYDITPAIDQQVAKDALGDAEQFVERSVIHLEKENYL